MTLNTVSELIEDIRQGKMIILMDNEDRENEGDLVIAASMVRPEDVNFMSKYARGLICLTITEERCQQLNLKSMVDSNQSAFSTNFTSSIEAAEGITTGISAHDRARTIRTAIAPQAQPQHLVQPGHVFPIVAQPGGVLVRAGHTEASCDLARMANLEAAAVIVEIMNENGSMARRPDLEKFSKLHNIKIGTIEDLIHYRMSNERCIECIREREINTTFGRFSIRTYKDTARDRLNQVIFTGAVDNGEPCLVRVHKPDPLRDYFTVIPYGKEQFGLWTLQAAMQKIAEEGRGAIVLIGSDLPGINLVERGLAEMFGEIDSPKSITHSNMEIGIGSQILRDLGIRKIRLMGAPIKYLGISGFELEVTEFIEPNWAI